MRKYHLLFAAIAAQTALVAFGEDYNSIPKESWVDKALLWVTAKDASTIDRTWTGSYVELWRDVRHPKSGWALGNYRRSGSAVPVFDSADANHPNVDFKAYTDWASRMKIFGVVDGQATWDAAPTGANDPVSTKVPDKSVKHVMMIFGSQRGGGRGVMTSCQRGGSLVDPPASDPIFKNSLPTWVNGAKVDPTKTGFNGSWQLLSFKPNQPYDLTAGWKLGDNSGANARGGGQRYGEVLFFDQDLTADERVAAEKWLAAKWGLEYTEPEPWILPDEQYGSTFGIQLTNVVTQASSGDTIKIKPGEHEIGSVYMKSGTYAISGGTTAWRAHVYPNGKMLNFVGDTTGHWDDKVIIRSNGTAGNGTACFFKRAGASDDGTMFTGITFENFKGCDNPNVTPSGGNLTADSMGGAIRGGSASIVAMNCVFRGNEARVAGAVSGITCQDCKFVNNHAVYAGGAGLYGHYTKCEFSENYSSGTAGALWWPDASTAIDSCNFYTNHSSNSGGAVTTTQYNSFTNCSFIGNYSTGSEGGALNLRARNTIVDCVFEGNWGRSGGAIYGGSDDGNGNGGSFTTIRRCVFRGNHTSLDYTGSNSSAGGAVYLADNRGSSAYYPPSPVTDCVFERNYSRDRAGAIQGGTLSNCTFTANYCFGLNSQEGVAVGFYNRASNNCDIINCRFTGNYIQSNGPNGKETSIVSASPRSRVYDCVFENNVVTNLNNGSRLGGILYANAAADLSELRVKNCLFVSNVVWSGSIVYRLGCTNCDFRVNEVPRGGGVLFDSKAVDSRLIGNRKWDYYFKCDVNRYDGAIDANSPACDALSSELIGCTFDGGVINNSRLDRCYMPSCTNAGSYCVFYGGGNYVTNTLVTGPLGNPDSKTKWRGIIYDWGRSTAKSEFVNCTFADLQIQPNLLYRTGAPFIYKANAGGSAVAYPINFINCLCHGHCYNGVTNDFAITIESIAAGSVNGVTMRNCMSGVYTNISNTVWSDFDNNYTVAEEDQRLVLTDEDMQYMMLGKNCPRYSLKSSSPARNVGDPLNFTDTDIDLAGNLRLRRGMIDIGAYQCWLNFMGTRLRFK